MKITWLGHSSFRIEIADQILLVDPWLNGNPMFPPERRAEAIAGTTHILISHGHGDHAADAPALAGELGAPVVGIYDLMQWFESQHSITSVQVTMVNAVHSSSLTGGAGPVYAGTESGFMIAGEGHTIYFSGDTDVMADMGVFNDLHAPDIGILCAGGHFTMDMKRAGYAAKKFFDFKTVIPCHYRTFPLLEQSASALKAALRGLIWVQVIYQDFLIVITQPLYIASKK